MVQCRTFFLFGFVLFVLVSLPFIGSVGASSEMWSRTYGGEYGNIVYSFDRASSVVETSDGGYALAGCTESFGAGSRVSWLVKTDGYGNVEWNQTYLEMSAGPLVQTTDGGFALAGEDGLVFQDFWLVKTDANGNHIWNRTFSGDCVDFVHSLVATSDGGFALGCIFGSLMEPDLFWLIKTDVEGNVEWSHTYGEGRTSSLVETSDGGFALAGSGGGDFWLIKTDEYGIIPEFPSWAILPLLLVATLVAVIYKKKLFSAD